MKRAIATGGAALVVALVVLLWPSEEPAVAPVAAPAPPRAPTPPPPLAPTPAAVAAVPATRQVPLEPLDDATTPLEVTFELFDESGHLAGAHVRLLPVREPRHAPAGATANVMGFARAALKAGTWEVQGEWEPASIDVSEGHTSFVLHQLPRRTISGTVLDADGEPFAGAVVRSEDGFLGWRTTSGFDGTFTLTSTARTVVLVAEHVEARGARGARPRWRVSLPAQVTLPASDVRLQLRDAAWVSGRAGCTETALWQQEVGGVWAAANLEEGIPVAAGVVAVRVRCVRDGVLAQGSARFTLAAGDSRVVRVQLTPMEPLRVRVLEANGVALPGVAVAAIAEGPYPGPTLRGTADAQGEVRFLPSTLESYALVYRLEVQGPWRNAREARAEIGDAPVQLDVVPSTP